MLQENKQTFFNQCLNNADTKTFWKTIRLLNHDYSSIPTLLDGDGSTTVESSSAKAACLNNIFYTCFNHNYPPLTDAAQDLNFPYGSLCPSHCPAQLPCTKESVLELLAGLDISNSTGSNGISPKMLKSTSLRLLHHYAGCSTSQYLLARFPLHGNWEELPRDTNKSLPSGYRPISVLPVATNSLSVMSRQLLKNFYR